MSRVMPAAALALAAAWLGACHLIFPFEITGADSGPDSTGVDVAAPEASATDAQSPPDTDIRDAPAQDSSKLASCPISFLAKTSVSTAPYSIDIAIDNTGRPHVFWIDSGGLMSHFWNNGPGSWTQEQVLGSLKADRLAAAIDSTGVHHAAYRSLSKMLYYTYKKGGGLLWQAPKAISTDYELGQSLDISDSGLNVYISASRDSATYGSDYRLYQVDNSTDPHAINLVWLQSSAASYRWGRLAVGALSVVTTVFADSGYLIQATPVGQKKWTGSKQVAGVSAGPIAVAAVANWFKLARANGADAPLIYSTWDGSSGSAHLGYALTGSSVDHHVVDIADGSNGRAYIAFRSTTAPLGLQLTWRDSKVWAAPTQLSNSVVSDVRMAVSPVKKEAWFVYLVGDTVKVACRSL